MKYLPLTKWRGSRVLAHIGITTLAIGWLVGCDENANEMPVEPAPPASLVQVSGDGQSATRKSALDKPFVVRVTDASGRPVPDVVVNWSGTEGFGILSHTSSTTDDDGKASVRLTLGRDLGTYVVQAVHGDLTPVEFQAEAVAAPPAAVAAIAGDGQTARISQPLINPLFVRVTGADGFPVPEVDVIWSVAAGGGMLSETTTRTDGTGRASVSFNLGPSVGTQVVSAAVTGVTEPASFELEATRPVTVVVEMREFSFVTPDGTATATILLGDTVRWINRHNTSVIRFGPIFDCNEPSHFSDPDSVPLERTVEWVYADADWLDESCTGRVSSTSAPPGGKHFDSGILHPGERFQFVPEVSGTWEYVDSINGGSGMLTAGSEVAGPIQHTATSNEEPEGGMSFDSGLLSPGEAFVFVPGVRGTWRYECEVHCPDTAACPAQIVVE